MSDQTILATTFAVLMGLLIWGKWRYDGVTLVCLATLVLFGVVPAESAFSGFGHPAVITVALVLLISRGLQEAGMVSLAGNLISRLTLSQNQYMIMIMVVAAFLSSFMNNIGAMALLLPIALSLCQKMEWNPSKFLMPLAFASILGGMNTVIGTPPNIIIAQYRQEYTGTAFNFFDYSFVGLAVSILGVLFIAFIVFRFVKVRENANYATRLIDLKNYLFEVTVKEDSKAIGMRLSEIKKISGPETEVLGVVNETGGVSRVSMSKKIQPEQILVIKTSPDDISSIQDKISEISDNRNISQPIKEKTGGSTFKNPDKKKSKGLSAWELIDAAGGRGLKVGGAQMSQKHCNFMINTGEATAADFECLGNEIVCKVKKYSGVELQWEIQKIGKF